MDQDDVWPAGLSAMDAAEADLVVVDPVPEVFLDEDRWADLAASLHLAPVMGQGDVVVRLPIGPWPFGPSGPGRAALAASLLDSREWRVVRAGAEVLNQLAADLVG
jgi:hypothetical protein